MTDHPIPQDVAIKALEQLYADLIRQRQLHHECNEHQAALVLDAEARGVCKAIAALPSPDLARIRPRSGP